MLSGAPGWKPNAQAELESCIILHSFTHSLLTRLPIHGSGVLEQTFYGSPPACPVLGILHNVGMSPANCRSSLTWFTPASWPGVRVVPGEPTSQLEAYAVLTVSCRVGHQYL